MKNLLRALFLSVLAMVSSCTVNPVTGENELSLVTRAQEIAIGEEQYAPSQQAQGGLYYLDPELQSYVANIGYKLAAVSEQPDLPYEFVVLNNSVPNAWTLPGGKIAINRGLMMELDDEAELAAVLSHEIVHAAARHSAAQMTRGNLVGITAQLATIAAASYGYSDLGNMASQLGSAAVMAKYSRDDELEADEYGMQYMARAGYDPRAAVDLQETFVRINSSNRQDFVSGLFASHPPSRARVEANEQYAAQFSTGERYRERYQSHIAQLRKDAPAYQSQDRALAELKKNNAQAALKYLDEAVRLQPAEAQFWEMRGHAWIMLKNSRNADNAYSSAIAKNPELFSAWLYRGISRYQQSELAGARDDLANSYRLLPTAAGAYYLGNVFLQQNNEEQAVKYLQQAMQSKDKELALAAYNKLALIELNQTPDKYIASQPFIGQDGYLHIAVKNRTGYAIQAVRVQLIEMVEPNTAGRSILIKRSFSLAAGQQVEINTGVGPYQDSRAAQKYRCRVVAAQLAK